MKTLLRTLEERALLLGRKITLPLARIGLFLVYFWFGILKLFGESPANPLVAGLLERTLPFLTFEQFIIGFGIYEMIIGIAFLFRRSERIGFWLIIPHLIMTTGPLLLLPAATWSGFLVPTLEGQYIIKNILILTAALTVFSRSTSSLATGWDKTVLK